MSRTFVFVVCGAVKHISALHFSIKALQKFSRHEIVVLTDSSRNEAPVIYHNIIDIKTPRQFDHHQASIFLKTSAYKYLPRGHLYCYLDTDVVALNWGVDDIFKYKTEIVNFSSDHCKIQKFSPYAVNCGCIEKLEILKEVLIKEFNSIISEYGEQAYVTDPVLLEKRENLLKKLDILKREKLRYFLTSLRFNFTIRNFKLHEDAYFLRSKKIWVDKNGRTILHDKPPELYSLIEKNTSWKRDKGNEKWIPPNGDFAENLVCNHLVQFIFKKFNIIVKKPNWQHWNGGVFLFDDNSLSFMESWHLKTLAIFEDYNWKNRDQVRLLPLRGNSV